MAQTSTYRSQKQAGKPGKRANVYMVYAMVNKFVLCKKNPSLNLIGHMPEIFLRGILCTIQKNEIYFTFIMRLILSRCTVSFNNYSTYFMAHSITLACFHVIEL